MAVGSCSSVVRALPAKAGGPAAGFGCLGFSSSSWLTNVDEMKDLDLWVLNYHDINWDAWDAW